MVYSYPSKPRGRQGENTCTLLSAQIITWHWLSETNSSSNSITPNICSWCAQKSKEVRKFKKGSSIINTSVTLLRKDFNSKRPSSFSPLTQGLGAQSRVWFLQTPTDVRTGSEKIRDELATLYLQGLHINIRTSYRALGRLHQNIPAQQPLVPTWKCTTQVPSPGIPRQDGPHQLWIQAARVTQQLQGLAVAAYTPVSLLWIHQTPKHEYPLLVPSVTQNRRGQSSPWPTCASSCSHSRGPGTPWLGANGFSSCTMQNPFGNTGPHLRRLELHRESPHCFFLDPRINI